MTSKTLKSAIWLTMMAGAVALAAPGGVEGPPEGKGRKPPSEATNNLSVPAIMVTGSHNPPEFNGFKICIGNDPIYGDRIQDLRRIIEAGKYSPGQALVKSKDISEEYENYLFEKQKK